MRTTLTLRLTLGLLLAAAAAASAEPSRTICYAGAQTAKVGTMQQTTHAVLERTYDPAKSEIRQRTWSDKNPTKEISMTGKIDAKAGTFEFDDPELGAKGSGKLEGKAWHWTAMTMTLAKGDLSITSNSKLTDTSLHQEATMSNKGKAMGTVVGDLTAFDCKQLDAKKAELAKAAGTGGTATGSGSAATPAKPAPATPAPAK